MLYQIYRATELDGCILMFFLLLILYALFGVKTRKSLPVYFLGGLAMYIVLYYLTFFMLPAVFSASGAANPRHPYWYGFLCTAVSAMVFSHVLLRGSPVSKLTYILFYLSFVQLFKITCIPLYSAEDSMPVNLYRRLDMLTSLLLYLLLGLFTLLCSRVKLPDTKGIFTPKYLLALYPPASILLFYGIRYSGAEIFSRYSEESLAAIILVAMPMLYYLFASMLRFFAEQRRLDQALDRANAQVERYRLSAELEDRLKLERHELKNRYMYIHTLLRQEKYTQLDAYLEQEIGQNIDALSTISTENPTIDYALNRKIRQAQNAGIKIYTEVLLPAAVPVDDAAFCTVFLNLINNAIEASLDEEQPDIHITLKCIQGYLYCEIANCVRAEKITENPELQTTKPDAANHGLGLRIVRETIRKNDGMLQMGLDSNYYKVSFMLPLRSDIHAQSAAGESCQHGSDEHTAYNC